jgi:large subunit ribosomal protein L25
MADIALVLETRTDRGSAASRRLRTEGKIPAVVYGHGDTPLSVTVDAKDLRGALAASARGSVLFDLVLGAERHLAIAREIQRHPVRQTVSHVDFQVVSRDEVVPAEVAVVLVGEALTVTRQGGTIDHALLSIHLRAKPADIPSVIEVDISEMDFGSTIRIADLKLAPGILIDLDPEAPIAVAQAPRAREEEAGEVGEGTEAEATTTEVAEES